MTGFQKHIAASLAFFGAALAALDARAEGAPCGPRDQVIERLTGHFGETRRAMALDPRGILEIFASEETGSWTVTITTPEGLTCLIAAGEHWTDAPGAPVTGPGV